MSTLTKLMEENNVLAMDLAKTIGCSKSTIYRKLKDNSFTIKEAIRIQEIHFPSIRIKSIFK